MVVANEHYPYGCYLRRIQSPIWELGKRVVGRLYNQPVSTVKTQGELARAVALQLVEMSGKFWPIRKIGSRPQVVEPAAKLPSTGIPKRARGEPVVMAQQLQLLRLEEYIQAAPNLSRSY